jgi:hypothetical protein
MSSPSWHIANAKGQRWNALRDTFDWWVWGTDYPTREAAESEALLIVMKYPSHLGIIAVEKSFEKGET